MILLGDVTFSTEGIVLISALLTGLAGTVGYIFKLLMKAKDDQIEKAESRARLLDEQNLKKSYKEIAEEMHIAAMVLANREREKEGKPPLRVLAPVVPEHSSPMTLVQEATAHLATLRAAATALSLEADLPPRDIPPVTESTTSNDTTDLTAKIDQLKDEGLRKEIATDIAGIKDDIAEVPEKASNLTVEKLKEVGLTPPPKPEE